MRRKWLVRVVYVTSLFRGHIEEWDSLTSLLRPVILCSDAADVQCDQNIYETTRQKDDIKDVNVLVCIQKNILPK